MSDKEFAYRLKTAMRFTKMQELKTYLASMSSTRMGFNGEQSQVNTTTRDIETQLRDINEELLWDLTDADLEHRQEERDKRELETEKERLGAMGVAK